MNEEQKLEPCVKRWARPKLPTSEFEAISKFGDDVSGTIGNNDYVIQMGIMALLCMGIPFKHSILRWSKMSSP